MKFDLNMSVWDLFSKGGGSAPEDFQTAKMEAMEKLLGPMHDMVGTPRKPFEHKGPEDGRLSRYYFPNVILSAGGTGFATGELMTADGKGPKNADGYYELVAFTREPFTCPAIPAALAEGKDIMTEPKEVEIPDTPYNRAENRIWFLLNSIAYYVTRQKAILKPGDTLELPGDEAAGQPSAHVFFARYSSRVKPFFTFKRMKAQLMLVVELNDAEFEKARQVGAVNMTNYLKGNGRWPYTVDM